VSLNVAPETAPTAPPRGAGAPRGGFTGKAAPDDKAPVDAAFDAAVDKAQAAVGVTAKSGVSVDA